MRAGHVFVGLLLAVLLVGAAPEAPGARGGDLPDATEPAGVVEPSGDLATPLPDDPPPDESLVAAQYLEESITHRDPEQEAMLQDLVDQAVEARLRGIPRPRYIPATDLAPPKGLVLHAQKGRGQFPFAMALGGYMQLRWLEFARSATSWTDSAGVTRPVNNINTFNLNRFLVSLNGHVADERLVYNFAFFGTSDVGIAQGVVPLGMAGWKFSDAALVGAGVTVVPGSREWVESAAWQMGVDRSMANTFFRPGYSPGVAAMGSLADATVHYQAGVWNAIDGGTAGVLRRGTSMAWAGNTWWEPLGPFGFGFGDMEHHDDPVVRLGTSGVFAPTYARIVADVNPENTIVRLSDGTPLAEANALGPGSQVDHFLYRLATIDAGWKHRGVAVAFEYYFRMLDDFRGTGTFERSSIFDQGGLGYLSWCFLPRTAEAYARSSVVTGPYGTGQEYGGGLNWYFRQSRQARLTFEALHMNRNPANNILYPYRAGFSGTAIQTQLMVVF